MCHQQCRLRRFKQKHTQSKAGNCSDENIVVRNLQDPVRQKYESRLRNRLKYDICFTNKTYIFHYVIDPYP